MGYHPIELDKTRNFRFGMRAFDLIEKKLKKPIAQIDPDNVTMQEVATIMWAGLAHEDKDLTPAKAMDLVDDHSDVITAMAVMWKAFAAAFGVDPDTIEAALSGEETKKAKNE